GIAPAPAAVSALLAASPRPRLWAALLIGMMGIGVGLIAVAGSPVPQRPPPANAPNPPPHVDRFGDPLPDGAVMRLGTDRRRAPNASLGLSPDGKTIVAVSNSLVVREWAVDDGRLLRVRRLANEITWGSILSPDGSWLLARDNYRSGENLNIWDVAAGRSIFSRPIPIPWQVCAADFDRGGGGVVILLAEQQRVSVVRIDFPSGKWREVCTLPFPKGEYLAVSPDGKTAAAAGTDRILVCLEL